MYRPTFSPLPIGAVTVPSPGTPVQLISVLVTAGICLAGESVPVNKATITSLPTNTGNVYLGIAGMNKTTLTGVLYVFTSANVSWPLTNNVGLNTYQFDGLYVDVDVAGEGVYGAIDQV